MKILKAFILLVTMLSFLITSTIALFFDDGIFIPNETYMTLSYIIAIAVTALCMFILYKSPNLKQTNILIFIGGFIVFSHLNMLSLGLNIPRIFQNINSFDSTNTQFILNKFKTTGACSYKFSLVDSFYFGRICTTKNEFYSSNQGDKLVLIGKYNFLGFYASSYEAKKSSTIQ